jgi:site-specific DNA-methyltransferase (adenine-specific)
VETTHEIRVGDARELALEPESVELVVTSPPYPMVEMWDDVFATQDPAIEAALADGDGEAAYEAMHALLDRVWTRVADALRPGGVVAVNVGDATRRIDGEFRLYPNHARITAGLSGTGLTQLPGIIWRKPTNSANKFMGSGTLPTNAYATLEHEHVLLFRKGGPRSFPPNDDDRYASAYFWEERNVWFSDAWEFRGTDQGLAADDGRRERSGAFPLELPLRLIRMYSIREDTVLDPFVGTGTTSLAAMLAGRSSVGVERDPELAAAFGERAVGAPDRSRELAGERLRRHREFIADNPDTANYEATHYDTRVVTRSERELRLSTVADVEEHTDSPLCLVATHEPY